MDAKTPVRPLKIDLPRWLLQVILILGLSLIPPGGDAPSAVPSGEGGNHPPPDSFLPFFTDLPVDAFRSEPTFLEEESSSDPFHEFIVEAANRYRLDPALIKAVIKAESGYDPHAVSGKGAQGLMQLMPSTARALGLEDMLDPEGNIDAGSKHLRHLLDRFQGDIRLSVAAYNAGLSRVRRYNDIPPIRETRNYVEKVLGYYSDYRQESEAGGDEA
jgi:soluble lytic murein transglycosylase-like protein